MLFVTHNGELARRCDKAIQVVDGRITRQTSSLAPPVVAGSESGVPWNHRHAAVEAWETCALEQKVPTRVHFERLRLGAAGGRALVSLSWPSLRFNSAELR